MQGCRIANRGQLALYEGRVRPRERPVGRVKCIRQDFVQAKIGYQQKTVVGRWLNPVRMRAFLTLLVRTMRPKILDASRLFAQSPISKNWQQNNISRSVVRN